VAAVPPGQENVGVVGLSEITHLATAFFCIVSSTLFTDTLPFGCQYWRTNDKIIKKKKKKHYV